MTDRTIIEAALAVEKATGVAATALVAIAHVESGGRAFASVDGRREPLIRFEGHWFDRLLADGKRAAARAAGLADPKAGAVRNPATQAARWALLRRAAAIDPEAAYAATSWGLGQIMGFHWKRLGFASAAALAEEARRSAEGQLFLVARFLKVDRLDLLLNARRFADFARAYNGPGFRTSRYDAAIAKAFEEAAQELGARETTAREAAPALPDGGKSRPAGWAGLLRGLSAALQWISHQTSTPAGRLFSSTSTERSSALPTIRQG